MGVTEPPYHLSDFLAGPPPGVTESWSPSAITDAHFGKKIGTPFVTAVSLEWQEVQGSAFVDLTRGVLMWNSNW